MLIYIIFYDNLHLYIHIFSYKIDSILYVTFKFKNLLYLDNAICL